MDKTWAKTMHRPPDNRETGALEELTPTVKARRFRQLLPVIEAKLEAGVRHADIIRALEKQGLALPENTYFTYLRRFRRETFKAGRQRVPAGQVHPLPGAEGAEPAASTNRDPVDARRPPTFDYDPRGIPDLLK